MGRGGELLLGKGKRRIGTYELANGIRARGIPCVRAACSQAETSLAREAAIVAEANGAHKGQRLGHNGRSGWLDWLRSAIWGA